MTPKSRGYAILGTPRSGSSHLCTLLASTEVLGKPEEYLNPSHEAHLFAGYPHPEHDIWERIKTVSMSDNGVYGIKAFYEQFSGYDPRDIYKNVLGLPIVFLTRNDKLGQAISLAKALQTRQWTSRNANIRKTPEYDVNSIDYCLNQILHHEVSLRHIFAINDIPSFHIVYEDFVQDPEDTIQRIGNLVGVEKIAIKPQSPLSIQRDAVSDEWRRRYVEDRGNRNSLHHFEIHSRWNRLGRKLSPLLNRLPSLERWMHAR